MTICVYFRGKNSRTRLELVEDARDGIVVVSKRRP